MMYKTCCYLLYTIYNIHSFINLCIFCSPFCEMHNRMSTVFIISKCCNKLYIHEVFSIFIARRYVEMNKTSWTYSIRNGIAILGQALTLYILYGPRSVAHLFIATCFFDLQYKIILELQ